MSRLEWMGVERMDGKHVAVSLAGRLEENPYADWKMLLRDIRQDLGRVSNDDVR